MQIVLRDLLVYGGTVKVTLDQPTYAEGRYLSEAHRLMRIMRMYGVLGGSGGDGNCNQMQLHYVNGVPAEYSTRERLEALIDLHQDRRLELRFEKPRMCAYGGKNPGHVRSMREVRAARKSGSQIQVSVLMRSNLPLTYQDVDAIGRAGGVAYGPYSRGSDKPAEWLGKIGLSSYLLDGEDPREEVNRMIVRARRAVV